MSNAEQAVIGARCYCDGFYGTVRFVGAVPPAKGQWIGVEWDESSRGKHSGDHEGTYYFTCSKPGSGSFMRPQKLLLGYSFLDALRKRYGGDKSVLVKGREEEEEEEEEEELCIISRNSLVTPVEVVGAEKVAKQQSQLDQLRRVSVREMLVCSADPPKLIATTAPNIQYLDMSHNLLLPSWAVLADICRELTHLRELNVSENISLSLPPNPLSLTSSFAAVTELYINKINLKWEQVCVIVSMFPSLQTLHSCHNNISTLNPPLPLKCLRLLNLEQNQLTSWTEVMNLSTLPNLQTLILNGNHIPHIFTPSDDSCMGDPNSWFTCLKTLSISNNDIHEWSSVTALATFPSLSDLRIKGNPLFQGQAGLTARELVISRLPRVKNLNGSQVTDRERMVAERFYLKHYNSEWSVAQASEEGKASFNRDHPLYTTLLDGHNIPMELLQAAKPAVSALKDSLLSVTVKCPDHPTARLLTKKLPAAMTVQKLKAMLQRVYRVDSASQRLSYEDRERGCEIKMGDDLRQLSFYSVQSGDTILLRY